MNEKQYFKNWRTAAFSSGSAASVLSDSGVYAIMRVERMMGLPQKTEVLYVGRSKNLRNRLHQHLDLATAHNAVSFIIDKSQLEFWWHSIPNEFVAKAEKTLINTLNPKTNKVKYKNK